MFSRECIVIRVNENPRNVSFNTAKTCWREENITSNDFEPNGIYYFVVFIQQATSSCQNLKMLFFLLLLDFREKINFYVIVIHDRAPTKFIRTINNHAASILSPICFRSTDNCRFRFLIEFKCRYSAEYFY